MNKVNIFDIEGTEFPAGRRTRVILGENGAINGEYFVQGFVVIYPGGSVPMHEHENVESYVILSGEGQMSVDEQSEPVGPYDCIYMEKGQKHSLQNTGTVDMHVMFVYAPKMIVDHWAKELSDDSRS
jgi:mannose-6-phosphate isomerase-like protein (cupin superfamily)